jgi:hypothetical protein
VFCVVIVPAAGLIFTQTAFKSIVTEAVAMCAYLNTDCYLIDDGGIVVFFNNFDRAAPVSSDSAY